MYELAAFIDLDDFKWLTEKGATSILLILGLGILWKALNLLIDKLITGLQNDNHALVVALHEEREQHINALVNMNKSLEERVLRLERKTDECEKDRLQLHEKLREAAARHI